MVFWSAGINSAAEVARKFQELNSRLPLSKANINEGLGKDGMLRAKAQLLDHSAHS